MNRRDFLKALGLGSSASALSACGIDDNRYYTPIEQYLPYVTRPEQTTPGTNSWFATTVGSGPNAWPVTAVHRDGRIINVSANRVAGLPLAVSSSYYLELQRLYSPDRVRQPTKGGAPVAWDAALGELAGAVRAARAAGKRVVWLGPYHSGFLVELLQGFTGGNALFWEPLGLDAEALAARALFGPGAGLPHYTLDRARYVLSFGAPFLSSNWRGPGPQAAFTAARSAENGVCRFAAVTPIKDQTHANADDWYACAPGSEAEVALAIAKLVADAKNYQGPARALLAAANPTQAAQASGIPEEKIREIATRFGADTRSIALPGGPIGASAAATRLAAATYLLNIVAGAEGFTSGGYRGPIATAAEIDQLVADMDAGRVGVLLLDDVDPVHDLPGGEKFGQALAKVDLPVAVTSHGNETTPGCKLVLPTHDALEDWGDEEPWAGLRIVRQPGAVPLYDTRPLGDILLDTWRAVDPATAPAGSWREWLQGRFAATFFAGAAPTVEAPAPGAPPAPAPAAAGVATSPAFQRFWEQLLQRGVHVTSTPPAPLEVTGTLDLAGGAPPSGNGAYFLVPFPHAFKLEGRYANEPWAGEVPDPMTGIVWDIWALVHPDTAAALGVGDNDLLAITTSAGTIEVGVEVHPCVRPDVIAVPMGGGFTAAKGRYAEGVGANVARAVAVARDPSGALVWQGTKCDARSTGREAELVSTFGADHDQGRRLAVVVDAQKWVDHHGDAPSEHAGELTGFHPHPMDRRLLEREAAWRKANPNAEPEQTEFVDFYPVPDHSTYRFAMTIDTNACTGCNACQIACYAENNLGIVGKWKIKRKRQMSWIRVERYFAEHSEDGSPSVHFVPVPCQHCGHAPCESVCPVLATYHTIDGLNAMVYNRCVGTRYCSNACPYSIRRFNYHTYDWPEPFNLQLNPDVTVRTMGVMEKCTFCVQRLRGTKAAVRSQGFTHTVPNEALYQLTACAEACPSQAIQFGNLLDPESVPAKTRKSGRSYLLLADLNTFPAINYLARASFHVHSDHGGGGAEPAAQSGEHHKEG